MSEQKIEGEKYLEAKLRRKIKKIGGLAIKLLPFDFTGLPDRLLLFKGGRIVFAEIKETKKSMRPRQDFVRRQLERLGFRVELLDTSEKIDKLISEYE